MPDAPVLPLLEVFVDGVATEPVPVKVGPREPVSVVDKEKPPMVVVAMSANYETSKQEGGEGITSSKRSEQACVNLYDAKNWKRSHKR